MKKQTIAVCPGSFDPVTVGHLDIIRRACGMFDRVIVVVMQNKYNKAPPMFTAYERKEMILRCIVDIENAEVDSYDGLLADYAHMKGAAAIVKGLRAVSDFEYEFQMALTNKKLNRQAETVFLTTSAENMYLSSSIVRMVGSMGGDISDFVPECIKPDIERRLTEKGAGK
ncbi:MAG TPA: pantetheine-phosphate adenylyltransferase [Ruminococcaceae bacterium]|nr:pantetheine-phosphate adenylyltransferase [Oscillospiraceae bacterium]